MSPSVRAMEPISRDQRTPRMSIKKPQARPNNDVMNPVNPNAHPAEISSMFKSFDKKRTSTESNEAV